MKKFLLFLICTSCVALVGCGDSKLEFSMSKVEVNTSTYYSSYQEDFKESIKYAKQYEMNAILTLRDSYNWNYFKEGDPIIEDEITPLGEYSSDKLLSILDINVDNLKHTIEEFNKKKDLDATLSEFLPTVDERLALSTVSIRYYLVTDDYLSSRNEVLTSANIDSEKRLMQVVTVVSDYGLYEGCYIWDGDHVIDAYILNNF